MNDSEILELYRAGEQERAFGEIVKAYSERLYWHVRNLVQNHDDTDDILQDVFVKVWRALPSFRSDSLLFTWLWRIATNEALSFLRRRNRGLRDAVETVPDNRAEQAQEQSGNVLENLTAPASIDPVRAQGLLQRAIAQLPARQKAVFCMRYYDEIPYEQIAEIMGVSQGALKASNHFAESRVRSFLKEHIDELSLTD